MKFYFHIASVLMVLNIITGCGTDDSFDDSNSTTLLTRPNYVEGVSNRNIKYWGSWKDIKSGNELYIASQNLNIEEIEENLIKIDSDYYLRNGSRNVKVSGGIYLPDIQTSSESSRNTKAVSGYASIGGIEVYLQNIQDSNINDTVITDENGTFESTSLPVGDYHMEITQDGFITRSDVSLVLEDENLGRFKLLSKGSANFKVVMGTDSEIFYADGSQYSGILRIKNIGKEIGKGLNYKISLKDSKEFKVEKTVGSILPNTYKDIRFQARFNQQYANIKNYKLEINIFDATGEQWNEEILIPVYKGYFTLNFKAEQSINGVLIYPTGKTEDFTTKYKKIKLPLTTKGDNYTLFFTNYGKLENEGFYGLSSNAEIKSFNSASDTSAYEPNDKLGDSELINENDSVISYLHYNDIDYWRISSSEDNTKTFEAIQNEKPIARISSFWNGELVTLDASESIDDEKVTKYTFTSSIDGDIYSGSNSKFSTNTLTIGNHKITLTVEDKFGDTSSNSLNIQVLKRNEKPVAKLYIEEKDYQEGEAILFDLSDSSDNKAVTKYTLNSSINGNFIQNKSFTENNKMIKYSKLSAGRHTITLTVFDEVGLSDNLVSKINIIGENPISRFTLCDDENDSLLSPNHKICMTGKNSISPNSTIEKYIFHSSKDGDLCSSSNKTCYKKLSLGEHNISLTTIAKNGLTDVNSFLLIVQELKPIAVLTSDKVSYPKGSLVVLSAINSKGIDSKIQNYKIVSSIDGELYNGSFYYSSYAKSISKYLSVGIHDINLTITDKIGNEATSSITIELVNLKPKAKLSVSKNVINKGDLIYLKSYYSSDSDGKIINYKFESSVDGELYSGTKDTFSTSSLSGKTHIITVTVTDDNNATDSATAEIEVINQKPTAYLSVNKTAYSQHIDFKVNADNSTDSDGTIMSYKLESSINGELYSGTNSEILVQNLSDGYHTLTLTVTDDDGKTDTTTKTINILKNSKPVPKLVIEDKEYFAKDMVYLDARESFDIDGSKDISNYKFTSSKDGLLYSGSNPYKYINSLSIGKHTITLKTTDKLGLSFETKTNLTIQNHLPKAVISISKTEFLSGESIYISGKNSTDIEGSIKFYKFESSKDGLLNSKSSFTTSNLSIGNHIIKLTVTDKNGGIGIIEKEIMIVQNQKPVSSLDLPNGDFYKNSQIKLDASNSSDSDGSILNYKFTSSKNGLLYSGSKTSYLATNLSVGTHSIILEVTDNLGLVSKTTQNLTILNRNPVAVISTSKTKYYSGETINFSGRSSSDSDNSIQKYKFEDSLIGLLSSSSSFSTSNFSIGTHIITLTVIDENGGIDTTTKNIEIVENFAPTSILNIARTEYYKNQSVILDGSSSLDKETAISKYIFTSSKDGKLYSGSNNSFSTSNLSVGIHTITLKTIDSLGLENETTKRVTILNKVPTAVISISKSSYSKDEVVYISGLNSYDSDGYIQSYSFKSSIDGSLNSSGSFSTSNLSVGTHIITLTVIDEDGGENSVTKTIEITNQKPQSFIKIEFHSYEIGSTILMDGSESNDSDGYISNYKFSSSLDGELHSGSESKWKVSNLSVGLHQITLEVTDNEGATETFSKELNIKEFPNQKPQAILEVQVGSDGNTISIQGYNSKDLDGFITKYSYSSDTDGQLGNDSNGTFTYSGLSKGSHIIILEVTDDNGEIGTSAKSIEITSSYNRDSVRIGSLDFQNANLPSSKTWKRATSYCDNLTLSDSRNWRLPTKSELLTVYENKEKFSNLQNSVYWSSSYYSYSYKYVVNLKTGYSIDKYYSSYYNVLCVSNIY